MPAGELILHAGFQQTGASMLQRALGRLRPQLRRHGVGFVSHAGLMELDALAGWEADEACDPQVVSAFDHGLAGLVEAEAAEVAQHSRYGVRAVVVSSDHLLGRGNVDSRDGRPFRPRAEPAIAQAIRATGAAQVRVVVYLRRQDRLMEFCYLREVQNGATHTFAEQFPQRFEPLLDYGELLERIADVPGVAQVVARPFELVGSSAKWYADDFLATLGLDGQLDLTPVSTDLTPYRMYSRRALTLALDVNEFLESERERRLVRQFLKTHFPGVDDESTRCVPAEDRARILDAYAPANGRLFERHLPTLPADAYASDEGTHRLGAATRPRSEEAPVARGKPPVAAARALARRGVAAVRALGRYPAGRGRVVMVASRPECGGPLLRQLLDAALWSAAGSDGCAPARVVSASLGDTRLARVLVGGRARLGAPWPWGEGRRVVVVARNPYDAVVARYIQRNRQAGDVPGSLSDFVRGPAAGLESLLATYDMWAEERRRRPEEVMLVRYEDLYEAPETVVRRVLEFASVSSAEDRALEEAVAVSGEGPLNERVGLAADHLEEGDVRHIDERIGRSLGAAAFGYGPDPAGSPEPARSCPADAR